MVFLGVGGGSHERGTPVAFSLSRAFSLARSRVDGMCSLSPSHSLALSLSRPLSLSLSLSRPLSLAFSLSGTACADMFRPHAVATPHTQGPSRGYPVLVLGAISSFV